MAKSWTLLADKKQQSNFFEQRPIELEIVSYLNSMYYLPLPINQFQQQTIIFHSAWINEYNMYLRRLA